MTFETVSEATRLCGALHRWRACQAGFYSRLHCGPTPDPDPGSAAITVVRNLHLGRNITSPIRKHYMVFLVDDSPSARLSIISNFEFILTPDTTTDVRLFRGFTTNIIDKALQLGAITEHRTNII